MLPNSTVDAPFYVVCDHCNGRVLERAFVDGELCLKCGGCGQILITSTAPYKPLSKSQIVVREMAWILVGGAAAGFVILALLHWFHLL